MKTNDLIALLEAAQAPVDTGLLRRALLLASLAALGATALLVVAILGLRPDIAQAAALPPMLVKAAFGAAVAGIALVMFIDSLRPGAPARLNMKLLALPFAALAAWAVWTLASVPMADWSAMTLGQNWLACLVSVPVFASVPFAALVLVGRRGAPVDLRRTGLAAGFASAGLAIVAYSLHCTDDAAPFVAAWYLLATLIAAAVATLAAPRLLRW